MSTVAGAAWLVVGPARANWLELRLGQPLLELRYDYSSDRLENGSEAVVDSRMEQFSPYLSLGLEATVVDPAILGLNLSLGLRKTTGRSGPVLAEADLESDVEAYSIGVSLLADNRFSLLATASKTDGRQEFELFDRSRTRAETRTLVFGMRRMAFPGTLTYETSDQDYLSRRGASVARRRDRFEGLTYRGARAWANSNLTAFARSQSYENPRAKGTGNRTDSLNLQYQLRPAEGGLRQAQARVAWFDRRAERGSAARRISLSSAALDGSAGFQHRPRLWSNHAVRVGRSAAGGASDSAQTDYSVSSSLHHRLYESLTTSLGGALAVADLGAGRLSNWSGSGAAAYSKRLPLGTRLTAGVRGAAQARRSYGVVGDALITGERHVAVVGALFRLDRTSVVPGSILVTSEGGSVIYREGLDWAAVTTGIVTEIHVLASGSIVDQQPLNVSYRAELPSHQEGRLWQQGFDAQLQRGGLAIYYRRDEIVDRTDADLALRFRGDSVAESWGALANWTRAGFSLGGQSSWERRDAPAFAYAQSSYSGNFSYSGWQRLSVGAGGARVRIDFDRPLLVRESANLGLNLTWSPLSSVSVFLRGEVRDLSDSAGYEERLLAETLRLQWAYGKMRVLAAATRYESRRGVFEGGSFSGTMVVQRTF